MHRSSMQRRQKMVRRWKRALFLAACAASFATSSFLFAEESSTAKRKLPTKSVTPVKLVAVTSAAASEELAPIVRPADAAQNLAPIVRSQDAKAAAAPATLVGLRVSPFRPVAIQAVPAPTQESESRSTTPALRLAALPAIPKPEVKAKPIPSKPLPVESQPEETLPPIVAASSFTRPGQKAAEAPAPQPEVASGPLSPWMQDVRDPQPEEKAEAAQVASQESVAPIATAAPARQSFAEPSIFERAATPALPDSEVAAAEEPVPFQELPAEQPPIKLAPIVQAPQAEPLVQEAPEPKRLTLPSKPIVAKSQARPEPKVETSRKSLVVAVQNEAAQPAAPIDPLPGPDKDADLKKHFEVIQQSGEFSVQVHRSKLLRTVKDIYRTAVVDDAVLEIVQFTPREISLIGRSQGSTHVTFWFDDPALQPVTYLVTVEPDSGQVKIDEEKYQLLEDMINEMFPDSKIHMQLIANKLVVRGQARDSEEAFQIMTLIRAQGMGMGGGGGGGGMGGGGFGGINEGMAADPLSDSATGSARRSNYQIINMLRVPGVQQVALRVKIAELNRTAARNFGLNLQGRIDVSSSTNGSKILLNSILGGGSTGGAGGVGAAPAILANFDGDDIAVGLNTLSQHGVIKLLSEPTLVTLSGNPATFIAGGEFAVPTIVGSAGLNAVTTDFRAFGAIISFLPTVVDKDRIRLQVAPEFSQINSGLTVNGTPGLKVRAATTTVEMREGQTLAIAGLLEDNMNANTAGDVPFLSKWIGRRGVTKAETELIILVTPELVHPMEPEEVPPLPGFDVSEPTNSQFYIHGDIEGNPTMDYRSTVWPRLKKRYKAGGPAMTSGPFGHGQ